MLTIFDGMDKEEIDIVIKQSISIKRKKNEAIFNVGDEASYLFVLLEGTIYVRDNSIEGHRNILTIISEKNDCFGEVYLYKDILYPYEAIAAIKSHVLCIPKEVIYKHHALSNNMNRILADKAFRLSRKLQLLMKDTLREKIIEYLQKHQQVNLKRFELAEYLGVSRPALSKEIYKMVDEGIVEIEEEGELKLIM